MKLILLISLIGIVLLAGCTITTTANKFIGTWDAQLVGVSRYWVFGEDTVLIVDPNFSYENWTYEYDDDTLTYIYEYKLTKYNETYTVPYKFVDDNTLVIFSEDKDVNFTLIRRQQ